MATTTSPVDIGVKWTRSDPFDNAFTISPSRVTPALDIPSKQSRLTFPKLTIPLRSPSASTSTDSEVVHSDPGAIDEHPSPSLLSYIFARQTSLGGSSSSNSHDTLLTPSLPSSCGPCGRPILRRPESTLTSPTSDDGLSKTLHISQGVSKMQSLHGGFNGLGLSIDSPSRVEKRQSCLTFAVKSPPSRPIATSLLSPRHARGLDVNLDEEAEYDEVEDEDSEDDGYQEDEEGGFTSDEDLTSAFTRHLPPSSGSSFISSRPYTPHAAYSPPFAREYVPMSTSTSDDGDSRPVRGRKISIATTKCAEKCSRHRSPPPTHRSLQGSPTAECPPAARSPSALGLCRRRETAVPQRAPVDGWRSDEPYARTRSQGPPQPCKSILVNCGTSSPGARRASMSAVGVLENAV